MHKIITNTEKIANKYLKDFGFEDEQIVSLITQAKIDLSRELENLEPLLNAEELEFNPINDSLHALKGLLFNLGNHKVAERLNDIRSDVKDLSVIDELQELLFDKKTTQLKEQNMLSLEKEIRVLYVEDNDMVRDSTALMLNEYFELEVDTAFDGEDALQKYQEFYKKEAYFYDIIITDINMPRMNGLEMINAISKLNKEQNIIVISAHSESKHLLELINMGISNFILKPIDFKRLEQLLLRVIETVKNQKIIKQYNDDIKAMNKDLHIAKKKAEEASMQKSQFLANMSHEIRTPLNAITGFIGLLKENENDSEKLKYLKVIQNSSDSLLQIINDILDFSKIESGKLEINPINFNPYNDLITIAELFQVKAAEKGVILKIQYNYKIPKFLYCDSLRIKQILSNLLSNAIKFTPEGSQVKCIIWYSKSSLNIRVKDYGIGIPEDKQKLIFEVFSQAENSIVREYGGTGLGLTISSKLTQMLLGSLTLKSKENKGSSFLLSIPMQIGEEIKEDTASHKSELPSDLHILLVEDNEANQMFIGIILDNVNVTYETANNGLEAIEKFKSGTFDIILMDENMPKLSGIGATKIILQLEKDNNLQHTPIISLTANALKGDREHFLQAGMDDYLSKPIEPSKLIQAIYKLLTCKTKLYKPLKKNKL